MSALAEDLAVRGRLQALARDIDKQLPYGWGFILLCFPFGQGGRMNYVSNAQRPDVVRALREFITATGETGWAEHAGELSAAAEDEQLGRARQRVEELEAELAKAMSLLGEADALIEQLERELKRS